MDPVTYTVTTQLPAPMERVFELLADPAKIARWLPAARAVSADGPLLKNAKLTIDFGERIAECDIVEYNPPRGFGWIERGGRRNWKTMFRLEFAGGTTSLTIQQVWLPASFLSWLRVKLRPNRNVPARLNAIVQNLRTALSR
jgi:uncharacterized protein YndB with AHSA1/START domain